MINWAFIYTSPECESQIHKAIIESPGRKVYIFGVNSIDAGCEVATKIVSANCDFIELCGGFGKEGAKKVIEAINDAVPVGYIVNFPGGDARIAEIVKKQ